MWAIFIAVFGGLYWIYKLAGERIGIREFEKKSAAREDRTRAWKDSVLDDNLNSKAISMSETEDGFSMLRQEALDVIRKLPGLEEANVSNFISDNSKRSFIYIYMVKRGKLPRWDEMQIPASIWRCTDLEFSKRSMVAFARWVEKTMRDNGHQSARLRYSRRLSGAVNCYEKRAVFLWEQTLFDLNDSIRVFDTDIEDNIIGELSEQTESRNATKIRSRQNMG